MQGDDSLILYGATSYYDAPKDALGKQFLQSLRKRCYDDFVNIDGTTGETLTCGQLIEYSVKLATAFKNMFLKQGDVICIVSENHIYYFVVVLAAFYIGATVSLLNPGYTIDELRHGFQFSNAKFIICSNSAVKNVMTLKEENDCISHVILLADVDEPNYNFKNLLYYIESTSVDIDRFEPEDIDPSETVAFIFLSSGTTGLPKGVLLTHQNMTVTVQNLGDPRYAVFKPGDRLLTVMPFFHMYGNLIQLVTLSMPVTTIILNKFEPNTYLKAIQMYQASKLIVIPQIAMFLIEYPLVENYNLSSIKEFINSGATLRGEILRKMSQRFHLTEMRQMYGITETAGFTLIHTLQSKEGSVGVPIPQVLVKIRNLETHEPLGPSQLGELCFKGPMVMKGYVKNDSATQNVMDDDGFFCSGDIGYYDEKGYFFIVDRIKEIIKYKGFQVSPSELEQLILTHPKVVDCGVVGLPSEKFGELPLAFIVKKRNQCLKAEEIINYVAEKISKHKRLYGGVRFVDEIPKNHSGKILRKKLKELL